MIQLSVEELVGLQNKMLEAVLGSIGIGKVAKIHDCQVFEPIVGQRVGVSHSFEVGKAYLIRTVTMHYTGRVVAVTDSDVVLEEAAWIADTGRYANSLTDGTLNEVEPYPGQVAVCRGAMVDFCEWKHQLPKVQK